MPTRARLRTGALAGSLTVILALAAPAYAQAPETTAEEPVVAVIDEDTDTNDDVPNNVVDDGDNEQPSGNDRSVENGGSGNQGNSESDPDGTSNGGADVPGGTGGTDPADQDGNNGCGNDDDFEDDNNGNCGGDRPTDVTPDQTPDTDTGTDTGTTDAPTPPVATAVLGTTFESAALDSTEITTTDVLGVEETRSPQTLARTGASTGQLALISISMIALGAIALRTRSRVLATVVAS
jgi:hypothetical protein